MDSHLETIYQILDECNELPTDQRSKLRRKIIYPLLICLSNEELVQMYWDCVDENRIVAQVENLIRNRIVTAGHAPFVSLVEQIYSQFREVDWNKYRRLRTFLTSIIEHFPQEYISEFFNYFYKREKISDHWKAYSVASLIWSDEVENKLWKKLYEEPDQKCLVILIQKGNLESLAEIFKEVWTSPNIQFWHKNNLLVRLAPVNFKAVSFLKKQYPISYMYAVVLAERKLTHKEAIELALKSKDAREFGFALWCVGKLGMFETLLELNSRIPELQKHYEIQEARKFGITDLHYFEN